MEERKRTIAAAIESMARLLPAQGPINVFVHHNPLHAFEDQPFEDAIIDAADRFECEPFLSEERYREEISKGRIATADIDVVLEGELGERASGLVCAELTRFQLQRAILVYGVPQAQGVSLRWLLSETSVLERLRSDIPPQNRNQILSNDSSCAQDGQEKAVVEEMWRTCLRSASASAKLRASTPTANSSDRPLGPHRTTRFVTHRRLFRDHYGVDIYRWIHPPLIRFLASYLDQGLAQWTMPERERGMYCAFAATHGCGSAGLGGPWAKRLCSLLKDDANHKRDAHTSLLHSLAELGVSSLDCENFLMAEGLALRGWAGIIGQLEKRPDLVPVRSFPARLVDYLAIRLLLTRAALLCAAQTYAPHCLPLATMRTTLLEEVSSPAAVSTVERAWILFHVCQLCAINPALLSRFSPAEVASLEEEIDGFTSTSRRRLLHLAYEMHFRHRFYDAITQHRGSEQEMPAKFQAVFCLDDREESIRRHLEEVDPGVETFGVAGYYGVAMYYQGSTDAHPRALCPVSVRPKHYLAEAKNVDQGRLRRLRGFRNSLGTQFHRKLYASSYSSSASALFMATIGVFWVVPLIIRVLFPRWGRAVETQSTHSHHPRAQLPIERQEVPVPLGSSWGYTHQEMAAVVYGQLAPTGITKHFADLVFVFGHGSSSLNNPQESAYDCGACGGGRGGPNARAFAKMANHPRVRELLASSHGFCIPSTTWFVGGQRNTASSDISFYDLETIPPALTEALSSAQASIEIARKREAQERCRRFANTSLSMSPTAALLHVQSRAADLAQPRTECGHASNAICIVGRRSKTRNLFLDRRAFLTSYDAALDESGVHLRNVLNAVVPVVLGINLEYFFGYVDPTGYGCGTKLPHNVTSLLGVMNGAQSDLRTGLPWQMVEIHEPMRLVFVVETSLVALQGVLETDAGLTKLVDGGWLRLASVDPQTQELYELRPQGAIKYESAHKLLTVEGPSRRHYQGKRGHLPFVSIGVKNLGSQAS